MRRKNKGFTGEKKENKGVSQRGKSRHGEKAG